MELSKIKNVVRWHQAPWRCAQQLVEMGTDSFNGLVSQETIPNLKVLCYSASSPKPPDVTMGNDQRPTPVNSMAPDTVDLTSLPEMVALAPHPPTLGHKKHVHVTIKLADSRIPAPIRNRSCGKDLLSPRMEKKISAEHRSPTELPLHSQTLLSPQTWQTCASTHESNIVTRYAGEEEGRSHLATDNNT